MGNNIYIYNSIYKIIGSLQNMDYLTWDRLRRELDIFNDFNFI